MRRGALRIIAVMSSLLATTHETIYIYIIDIIEKRHSPLVAESRRFCSFCAVIPLAAGHPPPFKKQLLIDRCISYWPMRSIQPTRLTLHLTVPKPSLLCPQQYSSRVDSKMLGKIRSTSPYPSFIFNLPVAMRRQTDVFKR